MNECASKVKSDANICDKKTMDALTKCAIQKGLPVAVQLKSFYQKEKSKISSMVDKMMVSFIFQLKKTNLPKKNTFFIQKKKKNRQNVFQKSRNSKRNPNQNKPSDYFHRKMSPGVFTGEKLNFF